MAFAYGSSSSLFGLQRRPWAGSYGPCTRKPYRWPGWMPGRKACQTYPSISGSRIALLVAVVVEQAQLDLLGHLAEDREVRAGAVVRGPEGVGAAGPDLGHRGCSSCLAPPWTGAGGPPARGAGVGRAGGVRWRCRVPPHSLRTPASRVSPAAPATATPDGRRRPPRRTAEGVVRRPAGTRRRRRRPDAARRGPTSPGEIPGWRWSSAWTAPATRHARAAPAPRTSSAVVSPRPGCPDGPRQPLATRSVTPPSYRRPVRTTTDIRPTQGRFTRRQRVRALRRPAGGDRGSSPSGSTRGRRTSSCSAPPAPASRRRRPG